jgi:hypothetical protein
VDAGRRALLLGASVVLLPVLPRASAGEDSLSVHLAGLAPFIGNTYRGEFAGSTAEYPVVDVTRWDRALNGQAVRVLHSVNDGAYGGETLILWDEEKDSLVFYYFTTAGFSTVGTMALEGRTMISREYVKDDPEGVTEVRVVSELRDDGAFRSQTRFLKQGVWIDGQSVLYHKDASARVVFR